MLVNSRTPKHLQQGFVASVLAIAVLIFLIGAAIVWMQIEGRKSEARRYLNVSLSHMRILNALEQHFSYHCNRTGVVPTATVDDLATQGFFDLALNYNPHEFDYEVSIDRASMTFDPITGRAQSDGATKLILTISNIDKKQRTLLQRAYRNQNISYQINGNEVIVNRDYVGNDEDVSNNFLLSGFQQDASGNHYVCR
ncbi:hypothetical protein EAY39_15070 [Vibrio anguillarum]|uniref:hypothetical protein n=2 Tax=Vibrio anguillarum TaxID=55601 RepID=UPI0018C2B6FD|nr:hypothetical protein [Vibrio anguillarum]MBF4342085.1 hypothetical protein [Vibrio anguillarum]